MDLDSLLSLLAEMQVSAEQVPSGTVLLDKTSGPDALAFEPDLEKFEQQQYTRALAGMSYEDVMSLDHYAAVLQDWQGVQQAMHGQISKDPRNPLKQLANKIYETGPIGAGLAAGADILPGIPFVDLIEPPEQLMGPGMENLRGLLGKIGILTSPKWGKAGALQGSKLAVQNYPLNRIIANSIQPVGYESKWPAFKKVLTSPTRLKEVLTDNPQYFMRSGTIGSELSEGVNRLVPYRMKFGLDPIPKGKDWSSIFKKGHAGTSPKSLLDNYIMGEKDKKLGQILAFSRSNPTLKSPGYLTPQKGKSTGGLLQDMLDKRDQTWLEKEMFNDIMGGYGLRKIPFANPLIKGSAKDFIPAETYRYFDKWDWAPNNPDQKWYKFLGKKNPLEVARMKEREMWDPHYRSDFDWEKSVKVPGLPLSLDPSLMQRVILDKLTKPVTIMGDVKIPKKYSGEQRFTKREAAEFLDRGKIRGKPLSPKQRWMFERILHQDDVIEATLPADTRWKY